MNTYKDARERYITDHLAKSLTQPERRLNALKAIEQVIKVKDSELLNGIALFEKYDKNGFTVLYEAWKGSSLSSAEKSIITGLFKFSK